MLEDTPTDAELRTKLLRMQAAGQEESVTTGDEDATGTDPRAFGTKFMPYYRYTQLENGLKVNELTLFGLVRYSDDIAVTYEIPIAERMDYSTVPGFASAGQTPLESDGDVTGHGDANFRVFVKNPNLRFGFSFSEKGSSEVIPLIEVTIPVASDDVLGGDALIISPGFAYIVDMPAMGFFASMNFYDFDGFRDESRGHTSRYRGRWFYMQPITPPGFVAKNDPDIPDLGILSGIYLLPEIQPVYDFVTSEFSLWIAPEVGKVISEGTVFYVKPGWGLEAEAVERDFTLEIGWRHFF